MRRDRCADVARRRLQARREGDDPLAMYLNDVCTIPVNLAGLPPSRVPCGFAAAACRSGCSSSAGRFDEATVLRVGARLRAGDRLAHPAAEPRRRTSDRTRHERPRTRPSSASRCTPSSRPEQDVLRLLDGLRRAAEHPRLSRSAWACPGAAGHQPRAPSIRAQTGAGARLRRSPAQAFARKNYSYPDLPKGYQISQYDVPLCRGRPARDRVGDRARGGIRVERVHLEEDAGKLIHSARAAASLVDFNRAGVPLMEMVSRAGSAHAARRPRVPAALRAILRYLGVCDGNMEEGSLRCDANVSLRPRGRDRARHARSRSRT